MYILVISLLHYIHCRISESWYMSKISGIFAPICNHCVVHITSVTHSHRTVRTSDVIWRWFQIAGTIVVVSKSCLLFLGLLTRLRLPATETDLTSQSAQGEANIFWNTQQDMIRLSFFIFLCALSHISDYFKVIRLTKLTGYSTRDRVMAQQTNLQYYGM